MANIRPVMGSLVKLLRRGTLNGFHHHNQKVIRSVSSSSTRNFGTDSKGEHRTKCTLIPGDGVGPEIMQCMQEVMKASGAPVDFEPYFLSDIQYSLSANIDDVVASIAKNGVCIKGILASPTTGEKASLNYQLRSRLDLFANVVHLKTLPAMPTRHKDIDIVVIREQTEGEFSSLEHETIPGVVECYKIVTEEKSRRIAKFAFDYAVKKGRKKVTAVHKANIMKLGDGLFLRTCEEVSKLYPKIEFESVIIDNCTMQLVSNPHQYDVLVMGNLYGAIVDNIGCGLVGGAGVVPGASFSSDAAVFEPGARHTYGSAIGKNLANPTAMLLCAAKMLEHVNLHSHGTMIRKAIDKVLTTGKCLTKDVGGQSTSKEFIYAVINKMH